MGEQATSGAISNMKNTLGGIKRLIGLTWTESAPERARWPAITFVEVKHPGKESTVGINVSVGSEKQVVPVEAVAGMLIHHLGSIASNDPLPQDWVISIPNYYTDAQRRALLTGCSMVGISGVQRLMHEATATALAYGIFKDIKKEFTAENPTNVMFLDIGASAFTVSIASFEPGKLAVKSAYCDPNLGGRDFDDAIAYWIADAFEAKFKGKLSAKPMERPKTRAKLLAAAEKAKKTLSPHGVKEARIQLEMLQDDLDFMAVLTADEYETKLCAPLLARLKEPIQLALTEAKLTPDDLASVEIVGGSTRIACVKKELMNIMGGKTLSMTMNADEAVARGAALQSAILSPRFKVLPYEIVEAQPYPIKLSWSDNGEGMEVEASGEATPTDSVVMFDRGLNFPVVRRVTLKRDGPFSVQCSYDEAAKQFGLAEVSKLATFDIQAPKGDEKKIRVNVKQDISGVIHLSSAQMVEEEESDEADGEGEEKKKKIKKTNLEVAVNRHVDWSQAEIDKAYEAEVAMANNDRIVQETSDMRNELESYIYDMRDKVSSDSQLGAYGSDSEKSKFLSANEAMENWLYEDGFDATKSVYADKLAELKKLGGPMEVRQQEAQERPAAVSTLQANLELYKNWANESQADERYQHISDTERATVHGACDEISAWMYDMLDKQGGLAANQDPILTAAHLKAKNQELAAKCSPIMHKPAPKPKKEEKPKEDNPSKDVPKQDDAMEGVEVTDEKQAGEAKEMDVE